MESGTLNQRLSLLLEHMHEAVLVENRDRQIIFANTAFCQLFSIPASPEQILGMDCSNAAEQSKGLFRDPEGFVLGVDKLLADQVEVKGEVLRMADGRWLERDYVPFFVADKYEGHFWKYRDVTKVRLLLQETERLAQVMGDRNESLREFARMVSHDLKAPLRGILFLTNIIGENLDEGDAENQECVRKIGQRVDAMRQLIEAITQYSLAGRDRSEFREFSLRTAIQDAATPYLWEERLELDLQGDFPVLYGHPGRIRQVFTQLIDNACRYSGHARTQVRITGSVNDEACTVSVSDNGPGIPELSREKVFAFGQKLISEDGESSSGYGLSIAKRIILNHDGRIAVVEPEGKGTKVEIWLPLLQAPDLIV